MGVVVNGTLVLAAIEAAFIASALRVGGNGLSMFYKDGAAIRRRLNHGSIASIRGLALEATSMGRRRSATTMPRPLRDHAALLNVDKERR
jgi:hypothetical protein